MALQPKSRRIITAWLITEYEPARKVLVAALRADAHFKLIGQAPSPMEAALTWNNQPRVIFVDAHFMYVPLPRRQNSPKSSSVNSPVIVLIGGRDFPAADAFDIGAIDFLNYIVAPERIRVALDRVRNRLL